MPWWGWLIVSLLGAALITVISLLLWFLGQLARAFRG